MSITAKELAKMLNLSEAAISMALNDKPGVSTKTRRMVIAAAEKYGYDFTKIKHSQKTKGTINYIVYRKDGAILKIQQTPFFLSLTESIAEHCKEKGYELVTITISDDTEVSLQLERAITPDCVGIILLGTEMHKEDFFPFAYIPYPIVALDTYFNSTKMDCILMNNDDGAYSATRFLMKRHQTQPGYLRSSYSMHNFDSRAEGFNRALRDGGLSPSNSLVHYLSPSMEGAYADMIEILKNGTKPADCYFADNDLIAAGAMKAFKEWGYKIPEDIGIIGFDNIPLCTYIEPKLSSVNVPIHYMGETAVDRLLEVIHAKHYRPVKIEVSTNLIVRDSV
ncbi:LacI family DNA-binding transcriptional regulator [Frisingicoccus sp.]|uniref:LacI family DNA-binding transcriptional regulator n=1 Tax=Frisingicoccus sp. TaxID=1918627 RepID=UPI002E982546|nr:LacI family DNA-binding transcriptional regulator [Frisingicoccus sp.]